MAADRLRQPASHRPLDRHARRRRPPRRHVLIQDRRHQIAQRRHRLARPLHVSEEASILRPGVAQQHRGAPQKPRRPCRAPATRWQRGARSPRRWSSGNVGRESSVLRKSLERSVTLAAKRRNSSGEISRGSMRDDSITAFTHGCGITTSSGNAHSSPPPRIPRLVHPLGHFIFVQVSDQSHRPPGYVPSLLPQSEVSCRSPCADESLATYQPWI